MRLRALAALAVLAAGASSASAQTSPRASAFKTIHLLAARPDQVAALRAAAGDFNRTFSQLGCTTCGYHLFRLGDATDGRWTFLMSADWPSPAEYARLHAAPAYRATTARNPVMAALARTEFYARAVEVSPTHPSEVARVARPAVRGRARLVAFVPQRRSVRMGPG